MTPRGRALGAAAVAAGAVAVTTVVQLLYQAGSRSWRTIWAEDGKIYYHQASTRGLGALTSGYAGYLQLLPRLLAVPAPAVPLEWLASYLALAGAFTTSVVALAVYALTDQAIPSRLLRAVLALACALHPVMAFENLANITNVIWPLTFACFWALTREPRSRLDVVLGAGIAFLAASSNGLCVLYLPLVAYVVFARRSAAPRIVIGAFLSGLLIQGVAALTTSTHGLSGHAQGLVKLFAARVLGSVAVGEQWAQDLFESGGYRLLLPFGGVAAALLLTLVVRSTGKTRHLGITAALYAVATFVVPLLIRGTSGAKLVTGHWTSAGARYAGLAILFLLSAVFVMLGEVRLPGPVVQTLTYGLAVQFVVIVAFAIPYENLRSAGPEWRPALAAAARKCAGHTRSLRAVPIPPDRGRWFVRLRCLEITDAVA